MPAEWPPYISHRQALDYWRCYADRFNLAPTSASRLP